MMSARRIVCLFWVACLIELHQPGNHGTIEASPLAANSSLIRLDLFRVGPSRGFEDANHEQLQRAQQLSFLASNGTGVRAGALRKQPLLLVDTVHYYARIRIGNPGQTYLVMIDTGSNDLWIPSIQCRDSQCLKRKSYDSSKSADYKRDGRATALRYGNGVRVHGRLSVDRVEIGGITLRQQTFLEALRLLGDGLQAVAFDGLLGVGIHGPDQADLQFKTPIVSLLEHDSVREKVFSFRITSKSSLEETINEHMLRQLNQEPPQSSGELIIGGIDHEAYRGQITWAPLISLVQWRFRLDAVKLQYSRSDGIRPENLFTETVGCLDGCSAIPDTGTLLIAGHAEEILYINARIGAQHAQGGLFVLPDCEHLESLPSLVVTISGRDFKLTPEQYIFKTPDGCISGLRIMGQAPFWILGDTFLSRFYTVLDYGNKQVGFADAQQ